MLLLGEMVSFTLVGILSLGARLGLTFYRLGTREPGMVAQARTTRLPSTSPPREAVSTAPLLVGPERALAGKDASPETRVDAWSRSLKPAAGRQTRIWLEPEGAPPEVLFGAQLCPKDGNVQRQLT